VKSQKAKNWQIWKPQCSLVYRISKKSTNRNSGIICDTFSTSILVTIMRGVLKTGIAIVSVQVG